MTTGKWALILGASSGFGAASARRFASEGWNVIGVHLDRKNTIHLAEEVIAEVEAAGGEALFFNRNAADPDTIEQILTEMREHLGPERRVHAMLHSLAFGSLLPFVSEDMKRVLKPKQLAMTTEVMANSLVYWVQGLVRHKLMGQGGRVLAMTSSGAGRVIPDYGAVSSAKAALESHIRQLSMELTPFGITANAVCAGVTVTPALKRIPNWEWLVFAAKVRNPHQRLGTPEDVAEVIVGLCDDRFRWINGNTIFADGGEDAVAVGKYTPESPPNVT